MKRTYKTLCIVAALMAVNTTAEAADAGAVFTGAVANTCVLTVGTPGVLTSDAGFTELSSDNSGGAESTVLALATGSAFKVSALAPSAFTVGSSSAVTFATDYTLSGATTATDVTGPTQTTLGSGLTTVSVDLAATKSSGTYAAGAYSATVTVRCE